jgi:hypothetical protein
VIGSTPLESIPIGDTGDEVRVTLEQRSGPPHAAIRSWAQGERGLESCGEAVRVGAAEIPALIEALTRALAHLNRPTLPVGYLGQSAELPQFVPPKRRPLRTTDR